METKSAHVVTIAVLAAVLCTIASAQAYSRESLGLYSGWGAFRDPSAQRCYAISKAIPSTKRRDYEPYAAVGTWPKRKVRGQIHFRMSRKMAPGKKIVLRIAGERFELTGGGGDAWAVNRKMDAAIIAKMRSAKKMTVFARGADGRGFSNTWPLAGAATAMDAASIGCAKLR